MSPTKEGNRKLIDYPQRDQRIDECGCGRRISLAPIEPERISLIRNIRYPLTILFVVVSFAGLGVSSLWSANHKFRQAHLDNARLRRERSELRRETGYLSVTDPQALHAIAISCSEELTWRWWSYVPNADLAPITRHFARSSMT